MGPKVDWLLTAEGLEASVGQRVTLKLPSNGQVSSVWGTGVYTNDSSIGSAAVHMGLLTFEKSGEVTIEIRKGQASYEGSIRNGVSSTPYGEWGESFVFINQYGIEIQIIGAQSIAPSASKEVVSTPKQELTEGIDWGNDVSKWSAEVGKRFTLTLPAGGDARALWGTGVYTDDSSIGTAQSTWA